MLHHLLSIKTVKKLNCTHEMDNYLAKLLLGYLHGETTTQHLARILHNYVQSTPADCGCKVAKLIPQCNLLLDLLKKEISQKNVEKTILTYVIKKLADELYEALLD